MNFFIYFVRSNPFLEREVQKSASACQLSRRDRNSVDKCLTPTTLNVEGVLKSHSANALHPEQLKETKLHKSQDIVKSVIIQTTIRKNEITEQGRKDTVELNKIENRSKPNKEIEINRRETTESDSKTAIESHRRKTEDLEDNKNRQQQSMSHQPAILRQKSETFVPVISKPPERSTFDRSVSVIESSKQADAMVARLSERAARIKAAKEKFFFSSTPMRREGTSSASDLRPGDR